MQLNYQGTSNTISTYWVNDPTNPGNIAQIRTYNTARDAEIASMITSPMTDAQLTAFYAAMSRDFSLIEIAGVPPPPTDITSQFSIHRNGFVLNRTTNTFDTTTVFTNNTASPIEPPLVVAVSGMPSSVTLANQTGLTPDGVPYIGVTGAPIQPGAAVSVIFKFANPQRLAIAPTFLTVYQQPPSFVPLPYGECVAECDYRFGLWGGTGCTLLSFVVPPPSALACYAAAFAGDLICRSKCEPPPPVSYSTLWCDESVNSSNFLSQSTGIHCGTNPVALATQFCDLFAGINNPPHYSTILPLSYTDPSTASFNCINFNSPQPQPVFPTDVVFQWAICGPQTFRGSGWYFQIRSGNPSSFCAGGPL